MAFLHFALFDVFTPSRLQFVHREAARAVPAPPLLHGSLPNRPLGRPVSQRDQSSPIHDADHPGRIGLGQELA